MNNEQIVHFDPSGICQQSNQKTLDHAYAPKNVYGTVLAEVESFIIDGDRLEVDVIHRKKRSLTGKNRSRKWESLRNRIRLVSRLDCKPEVAILNPHESLSLA